MMKCISPAINLTILPDGSVRPCCIAGEIFGNLNHSPIEDIINSQRAKDFRKKLLTDELPEQCRACSANEKIGQKSLRQDLADRFNQHQDLLKKVHPDGTIEDYSPVYLDLRESNICNLKCRMCHHELSSSWYEDTKKLRPDYEREKFLNASKLADEKLHEYLDNAEEIYFAGGEPLINERHFQILMHLIENKRFDVRLKYNTNFSGLTFKGSDYLELWSKFDNVSVGISLDDIGHRAEFSRKGTNWKQLETNLKRVSKFTTKTHFFYFITVSNYNVFNITGLVDYLIDNDLLHHQDLFMNILSYPQEQAVNELPDDLKDKAIRHLQDAISNPKYPQKAREAFKQITNALKLQGNAGVFDDFLKNNKLLDSIRGEDLFIALPEYKSYQGK